MPPARIVLRGGSYAAYDSFVLKAYARTSVSSGGPLSNRSAYVGFRTFRRMKEPLREPRES